MNIAGMGVVFTRGRGAAALEQALEQGWVAPGTVAVPAGSAPAYVVAPETLADKTVLAKARRADRFTRMAVLAAADALQDSGLAGRLDTSRLGTIVATALGPHTTTFGFLDGILEFGDAGVSPTAFSHSVHNAAASYIAMTLDVRGPTLTVTHFHFAFHQALLLADAWLAEGRCDHVLVGTVDEVGAVMAYASGRLCRTPADGRIKPLAFATAPEAVPGEGSVFFLVSRGEGAGYGRVAGAQLTAVPEPAPEGAVHLLDADGLSHDESGYRAVAREGLPVASYAPLCGSLMTISAFHAAVAALMLRRGRRYAVPVPDGAGDLQVCHESGPAEIRHVFCTRLDCAGNRVTLHLAR